MILRPYQQQAVDALYDYLRTKNGNPCIVIPTGGGKTPVMATICRDAVSKWNGRVLILAHVKELLEQTATTIAALAPEIPVGIYSAGLKSRDTDKPVIVAGIQSVFRRACELDRFDLIIVDECHLLPSEGEGMYQSFLKDARIVNPHVRLIGLTATPFRLKSGLLCGSDNLLNDICFEVGVKELIEQGFLCRLKTKSGGAKVDCSKLGIRAGEFIASEIDDLMNHDELVMSACREIIIQTEKRHAVLIFAASVAHAERVQSTMQKLSGLECGLVTGDTSAGERERLIKRFKNQRAVGSQLELPLRYNDPLPLGAGVDERNNVERTIEGEAYRDGTASSSLKYLVNVNILTTGFDAPNVDCVVMLRPTASAGLYYQMTGRGFRLHESKTDCLVLDYGGNILRHGPVDCIQIKDRKSGAGSHETPMKECLECHLLVHAAVATCPECGYAFPPPERETHDTAASQEGIISGEVIDTKYSVRNVYYAVHTKKGANEFAPKTIRVDYRVGFSEYKSEWLCPEHEGWARNRFEKWWTARSNEPLPDTAEDAVEIALMGGLAATKEITVRKITGEKYDRIIRYEVDEKPEPVNWNVDAFGEPLASDDYDEVPF